MGKGQHKLERNTDEAADRDAAQAIVAERQRRFSALWSSIVAWWRRNPDLQVNAANTVAQAQRLPAEVLRTQGVQNANTDAQTEKLRAEADIIRARAQVEKRKTDAEISLIEAQAKLTLAQALRELGEAMIALKQTGHEVRLTGEEVTIPRAIVRGPMDPEHDAEDK